MDWGSPLADTSALSLPPLYTPPLRPARSTMSTKVGDRHRQFLPSAVPGASRVEQHLQGLACIQQRATPDPHWQKPRLQSPLGPSRYRPRRSAFELLETILGIRPEAEDYHGGSPSSPALPTTTQPTSTTSSVSSVFSSAVRRDSDDLSSDDDEDKLVIDLDRDAGDDDVLEECCHPGSEAGLAGLLDQVEDLNADRIYDLADELVAIGDASDTHRTSTPITSQSVYSSVSTPPDVTSDLSSVPTTSPPVTGVSPSSQSACSLPVSSQSACSLPVSSPSACSLPVSSLSACSLPVSSLSACSLPVSSQSACSLPVSSQSACSLPVSSLSACSLSVSSLSACSLSASSQAASSLHTPLAVAYPMATLSQLNWSVTGIIEPASHLPATSLPTTSQPGSSLSASVAGDKTASQPQTSELPETKWPLSRPVFKFTYHPSSVQYSRKSVSILNSVATLRKDVKNPESKLVLIVPKGSSIPGCTSQQSTRKHVSGRLIVVIPPVSGSPATVTSPSMSSSSPTVTSPSMSSSSSTVTRPSMSSSSPTVTSPSMSSSSPTVTSPAMPSSSSTVTSPAMPSSSSTVTSPSMSSSSPIASFPAVSIVSETPAKAFSQLYPHEKKWLWQEFEENHYIGHSRHHLLSVQLGLKPDTIRDLFHGWRKAKFQHLKSSGQEHLIDEIRRSCFETLRNYQDPLRYGLTLTKKVSTTTNQIIDAYVPISLVTQPDPDPAVLQHDAQPMVIQPNPESEVLHPEPQPGILKQEVIQHYPQEVVVQQDLQPEVATQDHQSEVFQHDSQPVIIKHEPLPEAMQHDPKPEIVQCDPQPEVVQHIPQPEVVQHDLQPETIYHDLKPEVFPHDQSEIKPLVIQPNLQPEISQPHPQPMESLQSCIDQIDCQPQVVHNEAKPTLNPLSQPEIKALDTYPQDVPQDLSMQESHMDSPAQVYTSPETNQQMFDSHLWNIHKLHQGHSQRPLYAHQSQRIQQPYSHHRQHSRQSQYAHLPRPQHQPWQVRHHHQRHIQASSYPSKGPQGYYWQTPQNMWRPGRHQYAPERLTHQHQHRPVHRRRFQLQQPFGHPYYHHTPQQMQHPLHHQQQQQQFYTRHQQMYHVYPPQTNSLQLYPRHVSTPGMVCKQEYREAMDF